LKLLKDKKILVISSEVVPYLPQTEKAVNSFSISKKINDHGGMTRIFMPKYGIINERRHQLHEVIRLSGMNMIINDLYMPLIIKVASIPKERMQVYFIKDEEYFKRNDLFLSKEEKL
jgi:Glycogen synthase